MSHASRSNRPVQPDEAPGALAMRDGFLKRNILLAVVFLTGAAVLVVEVTATRILSPYFGNTIYTFSSVISVILGALSFGYYFGGRLADKYPSQRWFYAIISASGVAVLLVQLLVITIVPPIGHKLSISTGPLVLSMALFFLPGLLLGMLSPFALKLQQIASPDEGVGTVAGKVFFWSTIGSILGSLAAGFVLVPHVGLNKIMLIVGAVLVLIGAVGMLLNHGNKVAVGLLMLVSAAQLTAAAYVLSRPLPRGTRVVMDGLYERLAVQDIQVEGRPVRVLRQDRTFSGLVHLDNGELLEYAYYGGLARLFREPVSEILVIGGGSYLMPQYLADIYPTANVDVVEIEPYLYELGKQFFHLKPDPRLRNFVQDGRRFLHDSKKKYDLIHCDVYYGLTIPSHMAGREFFELARNCLQPNGVFMANVVGDLVFDPPSIVFSEIKTMRSVFTNSYFFATRGVNSKDTQSIVAMGINGEKPLDFAEAARRFAGSKVLAQLHKQRLDVEKLDLSKEVLFTDNYSPTEYIALKTLRREFAH